MKILGLDVGSTYIKSALIENKNLVALELTEISYNPLERYYIFIEKFKSDKIVATEYGRKLISLCYRNKIFSSFYQNNYKYRVTGHILFFAELEIISMIVKGIDRKEIFKAVHFSISQKITTMLKRVSFEKDIILVGAVLIINYKSFY